MVHILRVRGIVTSDIDNLINEGGSVDGDSEWESNR